MRRAVHPASRRERLERASAGAAEPGAPPYDIADLIGSEAGLPADLGTRKKPRSPRPSTCWGRPVFRPRGHFCDAACFVRPSTPGDQIDPVLELMEKYVSVRMSLADVCLVRMTEMFSNPLLPTTDRDFRIYRRHSRQVLPSVMPE